MARKWKNSLLELLMFAISLIVLVPIWIVVTNSLKPLRDANKLGIGLPKTIEWSNYAKVFEEGNIVKSFFNGMIMTSISVIFIIVCASAAAFVISRRRSKLTESVYYVFIAGLVVPSAMIPTYWILHNLEMIDTYSGMILIYICYGLPFSVFLYAGFINTIARDIDEAAFMDGCKQSRLFVSIILPLLQPVTMTVLVFNAIAVWNDVQNQLFFLSAAKWSMPMTVYGFFGKYSGSWNLVFADIVMTMIPLIVVFALCQRYIISGMTAGAVKA